MNQLFRKVALDRQSSPEQLDVLMQITSRRGWLSLVALGGLLLFAVAGGFLVDIPVRVAGQGILIREGGVYEIVSSSSGKVKGIYFEAGESIEKGRTLARIDQPELLAQIREAAASLNEIRADMDRKADSMSAQELRTLEDRIRYAERVLLNLQDEYDDYSKIRSPFTGRILELVIRTGEIVAKGTPLMRIELEGEQIESMQVVMYFPAGSGEKIRQGMAAEIAPLGIERSEYGFLKGIVTRVTNYPASTQGMMRVLRNEALVQDLSRLGPVIEATAHLIPDSNTPTGYKWSSSKGPATNLQTGMICYVSVTVTRQRLINFVFPSAGKPAPETEM
jgi:biotin carboxyl carrier protein